MSLKVILRQTCSAYPEQYDAYIGGKQVGYLRLRHGQFTVRAPNYEDGQIIYEAQPRGDGAFDDDERDYYLRFAVAAILEYRKRTQYRLLTERRTTPPPNVDYEIE